MKNCKSQDEQFDRKLVEILDRTPASRLLSIPGIYEILAEEYNNEIISELLNNVGWKGRLA